MQIQNFDPYDLLMTLKKRSIIQDNLIKNLENTQLETLELIKKQTETIKLLQESLHNLKAKQQI